MKTMQFGIIPTSGNANNCLLNSLSTYLLAHYVTSGAEPYVSAVNELLGPNKLQAFNSNQLSFSQAVIEMGKKLRTIYNQTVEPDQDFFDAVVFPYWEEAKNKADFVKSESPLTSMSDFSRAIESAVKAPNAQCHAWWNNTGKALYKKELASHSRILGTEALATLFKLPFLSELSLSIVTPGKKNPGEKASGKKVYRTQNEINKEPLNTTTLGNTILVKHQGVGGNHWEAVLPETLITELFEKKQLRLGARRPISLEIKVDPLAKAEQNNPPPVPATSTITPASSPSVASTGDKKQDKKPKNSSNTIDLIVIPAAVTVAPVEKPVPVVAKQTAQTFKEKHPAPYALPALNYSTPKEETALTQAGATELNKWNYPDFEEEITSFCKENNAVLVTNKNDITNKTVYNVKFAETQIELQVSPDRVSLPGSTNMNDFDFEFALKKALEFFIKTAVGNLDNNNPIKISPENFSNG
jgi:hypothetical protein